MKLRTLVTIAILAIGVNIACAQTLALSSSVSKSADGKFRVTSSLTAPNGCYSKGLEVASAPKGERAIENTVAVTFNLLHSGKDFCTQALKPISYSMELDAPQAAQAVIIYFVNRGAVSASALALPQSGTPKGIDAKPSPGVTK